MCWPWEDDSGDQLRQRELQIQQEQIALQKRMADDAEKQRQEMLADEKRRQDNIRTGQSKIDEAFAQFNDPWYERAKSDYLGASLPGLYEQYDKARGKTIAGLHEKGMLESTIGANALAELEKRAADERGRIGGEASDFVNSLKTNAQRSKNNLYDVNQSAADPNSIAAKATAEATTLAQSPGGYTQRPLGNVFADLLTPFTYGMQAYNNRLPNRSGGGSVASGSGSANFFG